MSYSLLGLANLCAVRDHLPLKQGLRRADGWGYWPNTGVRDHLPLKQGLRRPKN